MVKGHDGAYYSCEGIIRVMRDMVQALSKKGHKVIVTSLRGDAERILGFFRGNETHYTNIHIMNTDEYRYNVRSKFGGKIFDYVKAINSDHTIKSVIVPFYSSFPEAIKLKKPFCLYLPDFLPHFYPNDPVIDCSSFDRKVGKRLCSKAKVIFTPSRYSQSYLPETALQVCPSKLVYFPLPWLNAAQTGQVPKSDTDVISQLPSFFVFYPTRNRPSKRLRDFLKTILIVNQELEKKRRKERIYGVLTTEYSSDDDKLAGANKYVKCLPLLSDAALIQVYRKSLALLFTSENEGNFPTQVNEALHLDIPVVATNIQLITEELGELSSELQLVEVGDCERMAKRVLEIFANRDETIKKQANVRQFIKDRFSYETFSDNVDRMMRMMN